MNKPLIFLLPFLTLLLTGCPSDDYTVKLTPHGNQMLRELIVYRADGQDSNHVPKYEDLSTDELAAITAFYPAGALTKNGLICTVKGEFGEKMPGDVGGAGYYTNFATSLGSAGFYAERFRGNDDLAGQTEKRMHSANQLTDLVLGWTQVELGGETNYAALRQFLDTEFRRDLKNAAVYWHQASMDATPKSNSPTDYAVRFAQYLIERGYFKLSDAPDLFLSIGDSTGEKFMGFVQRLVARKLGVDDSQPIPKSLSFLHDSETTDKSFKKYFIGTQLYRDKLRDWKKDHETKDQEPDVDETVAGLLLESFEFNLFGDPPDHLSVKLSLPGPPSHTNGKWDETNHMVIWDQVLENKTNATHLPVFCYANWAQPMENFQKQHFGRVILIGDDLAAYCLWHATLNNKQQLEWEKLLTDLKPDDALKQKIKNLRLSDEPPAAGPEDQEKNTGYLGRAAIENALNGKNLQGGPSEASKSD